MREAFEFTAILSAALFAGAALYINIAEHPARMECGTELAASVFGPSYKRAAVMQVTLASAATLSAFVSWSFTGSPLWIVGALLIFGVIPFTLIVILPTNNRLLAPTLDRKAASTRQLLVRWGRLHAVRTIASLVATVLFLIAALRAEST
jgi:uncharacterized membrane protein